MRIRRATAVAAASPRGAAARRVTPGAPALAGRWREWPRLWGEAPAAAAAASMVAGDWRRPPAGVRQALADDPAAPVGIGGRGALLPPPPPPPPASVPHPPPTARQAAAADDALALRRRPQVVGGKPTTDPRLVRSLVRLFHVDPPGPPSYFCGGVVITERHILTAAHCAVVPGDIVALGSAAMYGGINRTVVGVTGHPTAAAPAYAMADIAVVEFAAPASATAAAADLAAAGVGPAALSLDPEMPGVNLSVTLAGWGPTTEAGKAAAVRAQPLTAVTMTTWDRAACVTFHDQILKDVPADQFCAGGGGKRSCQGDSGSPLVVLRPAPAPLLVVGLVEGGVELFNKPCTALAPTVLTRIGPYKWWMQGAVGASRLTIEGSRTGL